MKVRGCLFNGVFAVVALVAFAFSTYYSFKFFVRGRTVRTPALVGRTLEDARAMTSDLGVILEVDDSRARNSDDVQSGAVVWQSRKAGTLIKRGTRLYVAKSLGPLVLRVPDLSGEAARAALLRFTQQNLSAGVVSYMDLPGMKGVIATSPAAGAVVKNDTPISILVAREDASRVWVMPDLINHAVDDVRPVLENAGLKIATVRWEAYPGIPNGTIIRQFPLPGHPVDARRPITLVASRTATLPGIE